MLPRVSEPVQIQVQTPSVRLYETRRVRKLQSPCTFLSLYLPPTRSLPPETFAHITHRDGFSITHSRVLSRGYVVLVDSEEIKTCGDHNRRSRKPSAPMCAI